MYSKYIKCTENNHFEHPYSGSSQFTRRFKTELFGKPYLYFMLYVLHTFHNSIHSGKECVY